MANYKVELRSCGNPDIGESPYKPVNGAKKCMVRVNSIEEAQKAVRDYIKTYDLGGSQFAGGNVWLGSEYVGCVSYNGRFWDKDHPYGKLNKF